MTDRCVHGCSRRLTAAVRNRIDPAHRKSARPCRRRRRINVMNRGRGRSALSPNADHPARRFSRAEHAPRRRRPLITHTHHPAQPHTPVNPNRRGSGYALPRAGPGSRERAQGRQRLPVRGGEAVGRRCAAPLMLKKVLWESPAGFGQSLLGAPGVSIGGLAASHNRGWTTSSPGAHVRLCDNCTCSASGLRVT